MSADLMAAGLHFGFFCFISAAIPDMCGAAMLVPDIIANPSPAINFNRRKRILFFNLVILEKDFGIPF